MEERGKVNGTLGNQALLASFFVLIWGKSLFGGILFGGVELIAKITPPPTYTSTLPIQTQVFVAWDKENHKCVPGIIFYIDDNNTLS